MLCLKFTNLIPFLDLLLRDDGISHETVLVTEIHVMLTQFFIVVPKHRFDVVGGRLQGAVHILGALHLILNCVEALTSV
jgi:hypothetical protein